MKINYALEKIRQHSQAESCITICTAFHDSHAIKEGWQLHTLELNSREIRQQSESIHSSRVPLVKQQTELFLQF